MKEDIIYEYEMTVVYNETTITINWEEDYI